jgi:hypothetical protein
MPKIRVVGGSRPWRRQSCGSVEVLAGDWWPPHPKLTTLTGCVAGVVRVAAGMNEKESALRTDWLPSPR